MRYWTGLLLFAGAAWLLRSALARRARVLNARAGPVGTPRERVARDDGRRPPPLVVLALAVVGVKMSFAYFAFGGSRVLSLFDLAGLLALLAAYGTSVTFAARYREPRPVGAPRAAPARPAAAVENREPAEAA